MLEEHVVCSTYCNEGAGSEPTGRQVGHKPDMRKLKDCMKTQVKKERVPMDTKASGGCQQSLDGFVQFPFRQFLHGP